MRLTLILEIAALAVVLLAIAGVVVRRFLAGIHRDLANQLEEKRIEDGAWRVAEWTHDAPHK